MLLGSLFVFMLAWEILNFAKSLDHVRSTSFLFNSEKAEREKLIV